jgi:hypothetical protein
MIRFQHTILVLWVNHATHKLAAHGTRVHQPASSESTDNARDPNFARQCMDETNSETARIARHVSFTLNYETSVKR